MELVVFDSQRRMHHYPDAQAVNVSFLQDGQTLMITYRAGLTRHFAPDEWIRLNVIRITETEPGERLRWFRDIQVED